MAELRVVVGAGSVGRAVTMLRAAAGHQVRVVTRSGSGPEHPCVTRIALDAADASALGDVSRGATAIHNCANPPYHRWPVEWPPIGSSLLTAAEANGALLATVSNLYGYGPLDEPMAPSMPDAPTDAKGRVRAAMWAQAMTAHEAGRVRAVEVRASDFLDAGEQSAIGRLLPTILAGKRLRVIGDPDQLHSWTTTGDTAATLVAAADDPAAHGRVWHVPSNAPRTQRQALTDIARLAGRPLPSVSSVGATTLRVGGLFVPMLRELVGTLYQFTAPFVIDDRAAREHFGLEPEPWEAVLTRMLAAAGVEPATDKVG